MKKFIETSQGLLNINCIKLMKIVSTEIENERVYEYYKNLICIGD